MLFIANAVTWNRYLQIKQCLKVADNKNLVGGSKIAKVKPIYDAFNMTLKQFRNLHDKISTDQTIVSHKRLQLIDQFMKSKPIKFGWKIWSLWSLLHQLGL